MGKSPPSVGERSPLRGARSRKQAGTPIAHRDNGLGSTHAHQSIRRDHNGRRLSGTSAGRRRRDGRRGGRRDGRGTTTETTSASPTAHHPARGTLIDAEPLYTLATAGDAAEELDRAGFDGDVARYGVNAYRLVYHTVDEQGRPTVASGLLALPRTRDTALYPVSFTHGTGVNRNDAPSMTRRDFVSGATISYAAAGFAGVAPDYLGMALGPGPHPYMDVPSETTASLDMLRAARAFAPSAGHSLRPDVLATGFSQGAAAALGLGRALQEGADDWFRLAALAPVSGPYDLAGTELPALLDGRLDPKMSTVYTAYTLVAFHRLDGGMYDEPGEVFRSPYDDTMEELFDGTHSGAEIRAGIPDTVDELLTPHGRRVLESPDGAFAETLHEAGEVCADWAPRVPTRLYLATDDEQVLTDNTEWCHDALRTAGARPRLVDLGTTDYAGSRHLGSSVAATTATIAWFDRLVG